MGLMLMIGLAREGGVGIAVLNALLFGGTQTFTGSPSVVECSSVYSLSDGCINCQACSSQPSAGAKFGLSNKLPGNLVSTQKKKKKKKKRTATNK